MQPLSIHALPVRQRNTAGDGCHPRRCCCIVLFSYGWLRVVGIGVKLERGLDGAEYPPATFQLFPWRISMAVSAGCCRQEVWWV